MSSVDGRANRGGPVSETFLCDECGAAAATLHFLPPSIADPRLVPEPPGVPPGMSHFDDEWYRLSIEGGPVPVTITISKGHDAEVLSAIQDRDIPRLWQVKSEFAPFWCRACSKSYCRDHWRTETIYDEGFFDYIEGHCPQNHRQMLMD